MVFRHPAGKPASWRTEAMAQKVAGENSGPLRTTVLPQARGCRQARRPRMYGAFLSGRGSARGALAPHALLLPRRNAQHNTIRLFVNQCTRPLGSHGRYCALDCLDQSGNIFTCIDCEPKYEFKHGPLRARLLSHVLPTLILPFRKPFSGPEEDVAPDRRF